MPATILYGKPISEKIKAELSQEINDLKAKGVNITLCAIQVGENPESRVYVNSQKKNSEAIGMTYQLHELSATTTQEELISYIRKLNNDPSVNGIILQLPLPKGLNHQLAQNIIEPKKDVEGVTPTNVGLLTYGQHRVAPCTALGAMELIKATGVKLKGAEVVVIGYSNIVGKPVSLLLTHQYATVTICRSGAGERGTVPVHAKRAEVLVAAIGKAEYVKGDWVNDGAIVIDVGINVVADNKIVGDVEFERAKEKASYITPVPGGAGVLTVTMLIKNTVEATKWQLEE